MKIEIKYIPSPTQRIFHATTADEVLFGGKVGGGKSCAIVIDALINAVKYPGAIIYCFRRTCPELDDTLVTEMRKFYPRDGIGKFNEGSRTFHLINGSEIRFRHCQHEKDVTKFQGAQIMLLYIDEITHWTMYMYDYLGTRTRVPIELGFKAQKKLSGNPGGPGHQWVKSQFIDDMVPNEIKTTRLYSKFLKKWYQTTIQVIPSSVEDNIHLDETYILELERKPEQLQRALLYGDWDIFEGQAFPEWRNVRENYDTGIQTHVINPFTIPAHWPIIRGYDYGSGEPYSVLWFTIGDSTHDNRFYLIKELWGAAKGEFNKGLRETIVQQAAKIWEIEHTPQVLKFLDTDGQQQEVVIDMRKHKFIDAVADPTIWDNSAGTAVCIGEMFLDYGVVDDEGTVTRRPIIFRDARFETEVRRNVLTNRIQGKQIFQDALMFRPDGKPGIQTFCTCPEYNKHIPALMMDPDNPEDVVTKHVEDHDYDVTRYVLVLKRPRVLNKGVKRKRQDIGGNPLAQDDDPQLLIISGR